MSYSFSTAIAVGFEEQFYGNVESGGSVRVCAAILNPGGCTVVFPFTVILNTFENTAGILCRSGHSAILCNFASVSSCFGVLESIISLIPQILLQISYTRTVQNYV